MPTSIRKQEAQPQDPTPQKPEEKKEGPKENEEGKKKEPKEKEAKKKRRRQRQSTLRKRRRNQKRRPWRWKKRPRQRTDPPKKEDEPKNKEAGGKRKKQKDEEAGPACRLVHCDFDANSWNTPIVLKTPANYAGIVLCLFNMPSTFQHLWPCCHWQADDAKRSKRQDKFFLSWREHFSQPRLPPCSGEDAHDRPSPESDQTEEAKQSVLVLAWGIKLVIVKPQLGATFLNAFTIKGAHGILLLRFSINRAEVRAKVVAVCEKAWQNQVRWCSLTSLCTSLCWTGK